MPTKDSGKPTSRKRTGGAGKGVESSSGQSRTATRKRPAPRPEQATPEANPTPAPAPAPTETAAASPRARRAPHPPASTPSATTASSANTAALVPLEPIARELSEEQLPSLSAEPSVPAEVVEPVAEPLPAEPIVAAEQAGAPSEALEEPPPAAAAETAAAETAAVRAIAFEEGEPEPEAQPAEELLPDDEPPRRRDRRGAGTNALGVFIERQFANPTSPAHSYSDLERHSGISREALSRYVTARVDRRRSPTIDTLVAIADALHVSLEAVARAAGASVKGVIPPPEDVQHAREEALGALVAALSDEQFNAVVELLRQMRPPIG